MNDTTNIDLTPEELGLIEKKRTTESKVRDEKAARDLAGYTAWVNEMKKHNSRLRAMAAELEAADKDGILTMTMTSTLKQHSTGDDYIMDSIKIRFDVPGDTFGGRIYIEDHRVSSPGSLRLSSRGFKYRIEVGGGGSRRMFKSPATVIKRAEEYIVIGNTKIKHVQATASLQDRAMACAKSRYKGAEVTLDKERHYNKWTNYKPATIKVTRGERSVFFTFTKKAGEVVLNVHRINIGETLTGKFVADMEDAS